MVLQYEYHDVPKIHIVEIATIAGQINLFVLNPELRAIADETRGSV